MNQQSTAVDVSADQTRLLNTHGQVDAHTIRARAAERESLRADIDAFLRGGGKITPVAANLRADAPRRPQNNYGKGSL